MNKENNIIINLHNNLFLSINNLIKREKLLAEYFISQRDYKMVENFYLDLIILADDLRQILERPYDYESLGKYKSQIIQIYKENNIDIDIENLNPAKRKSELEIISDDISWANNGQWIDLTNDLYIIRKNYEIQASIKMASKNLLGVRKIYQRIIGINELLGNSLEAEGNFSQAIKILEKIDQEDMEISINYNLAKAYYNHVEYFKDRKNFDKAIVYAKKGVEICQKDKGKSYKIALNAVLIDLYNSLTEVYFLKGDLIMSSKYASLSANLANKFDQKLGRKFSKEKLDRPLLNRARILNK